MIELDRLEWEHRGLCCLIIRHPTLGHLCGYVGVPPAHPLFGKEYRQCLRGCPCVLSERFGAWVKEWPCVWEEGHSAIIRLFDVHGGITFCGQGDEYPEGRWWIGFDCAHAWDFVPGLPNLGSNVGAFSTYRDMDYVKRETECLANQICAYTLLEAAGCDGGDI